MILFSINPAFDMLPANEDMNVMFADTFEESLSGTDPERADFYRSCVINNVGLTVMKPFAMQDKVPKTIKEHYLSLPHTASECLHCGACESRCPFEVKVSERMQKAAELFSK